MSQKNKFADIFASEYGVSAGDFIESDLSTSSELSDIFALEYGTKIDKPVDDSQTLWTDEELDLDMAELDRIEKEYTVPNLPNTSITTVGDSGTEILNQVLRNPNSAEPIAKNVANNDYELSQSVDSSDHSLFQINDKYWNKASMEMSGKPVSDLSIFEHIDLASNIEKSPLGYSNWVAYQNKGHQQFDGVSDSELINKYNIQPEVVEYINQPGKFDNPQLIKEIMLAESGGDQSAINVNYSPQKQGEEIIPDWAKNTAQFITTQPESTYRGDKRTAPVEEWSEITAYPEDGPDAVARKKYFEENTLAPLVAVAMEKSLLGKVFGVEPEIQQQMEALGVEKSLGFDVASSVASFLTPLDAFAFNRLAKLGYAVGGPSLSKMTQKLISSGVAPDKAAKLVQKSVAGYIAKSTSLGNAVGGHSAMASLFDQLNQAGISDFDASAVSKSYLHGAISGIAGGVGAGVFGKATSGMHKHVGTVGELVGEIAGFGTAGAVMDESDKPLMEKLTDSYIHSAAMILSLRLIHQTSRVSKEKIQSLSKEDVAERIETVHQQKLAEKSEQLELNFEQQITETFNEAVYEVGRQIELPLDVKTQDVYRPAIKQMVKDSQKTPKVSEKDIVEKEKRTVRTQKQKDNTGVDIDLSKERTKQAQKSEVKTEPDLDRDVPTQEPSSKLEIRKKETQESKSDLKKKKETKTKQKQINPIIRVEKSSELQPGKNEQKIKGERGVTLKNKDNFDSWVNKKQSKHLGTNISVRYVERPDGKVVAKVFEVTKDQPLEKTTKGFDKKIEKEDLGAPEIPNPENAYSEKIKIQRLEHEINELAFGRGKQMQELLMLETKSMDLFNKDLSKLNEKETLQITQETGRSADYMQKIRLSIDARNKRIKQSKKELRRKMTAQELALDTVEKLARRTSPGAIGGKKSKQSEQQKSLDSDIVSNIKEMWRRTSSGLGVSKSKFLNYLSDVGLKDKSITKYINENFEELKLRAELENLQEVSDHILKTPKKSEGKPRPVRKTTDDLQYAGATSLPSMFPNYNQGHQLKILKELIEHSGYEYTEKKIRNVRSVKEIRRNSRKKDVQTELMRRIFNDQLETLNFSEHMIGVADLTKTMVEIMAKKPELMSDPTFNEFATKTIDVFQQFRSEAGRALRAAGIEPKINEKIFEILTNTPDGQGKQGVLLVDALEKIHSAKIKDPSATAKAMWMVAEALRNNKLLSGTSVYKSVVGNAQHSAMEILSNKSGLRLGWSSILDPKREKSGISKFDYNKYSIINRTEIYREALFGENGGLKTAVEIMKENPEYLRDNPLLLNEGYSTFIPDFSYTTSSGKKINIPIGKLTRIPQNTQGALDALYRVPWTLARFHELAIRESVKELRKEKAELTNESVTDRYNEILEDGAISDRLLKRSKKYGAEMVFQAPFKTGIGKRANSLRTKQDSPGSAFLNIELPFLLTYKNVFSKVFEYSPAVFATHNFWKGVQMHRGSLHVNPFKKGSGAVEKNSDMLAEVMARATLGTALSALATGTALSLKTKGAITGSQADLEPEERDLQRVLGKRPFSLTMGDTNIPLSTLGDPWSIYFQSAISYNDDHSASNKTAFEKAGRTVGEYLNNSPMFLQMDYVADIASGRMTLPEFVARKTAGELPPTFLKQLKSIQDGQVRRFPRNLMTETGEKRGFWETYVDASKKELSPFWVFSEKDIDPSRLAYDLFGNPVPKDSDLKALINIRVAENKTDDPEYIVEQEYLKVFPDKGANLKYLGGKLNYGDGYTIELSPQELAYLHENIGKGFKSFMYNQIDKTNWDRLPLELKQQAFTAGYNYVKETAKATLLNNYYNLGRYVKAFDEIAKYENGLITVNGLKELPSEKKQIIQEKLEILKNKALPSMPDEELNELYELIRTPNRYNANKKEAMGLFKQYMPQGERWMLNNVELFEKAILDRLTNHQGITTQYDENSPTFSLEPVDSQ